MTTQNKHLTLAILISLTVVGLSCYGIAVYEQHQLKVAAKQTESAQIILEAANKTNKTRTDHLIALSTENTELKQQKAALCAKLGTYSTTKVPVVLPSYCNV